jgi:hypothetical protein
MSNFNNDLAYSERTWQNDADAREHAQQGREEIEMQDWQEQDAELLDQARHAPRIALARCDGDGILEEYYFDVDQTHVIMCPGCCACEPELVEFNGRKPAMSEGTPGSGRKVA